jgi:hypothetical protein
VGPTWSGATTKQVFSIGAGAQQDLPVGRARVGGERRRHEEHLRPPQRERAVELGKAKVVADGQADRDAVDVGGHE